MIAWALANWSKVIVGILILSITIYIGILKFQLGSARGEAAELRGKVSELQAENGEWKRVYGILTDKVAEQNAAVQKLEEARKLALKKRAQADKKAKAIQAQARHKENALQAIPASSGTCESELDTIKQLLGARHE